MKIQWHTNKIFLLFAFLFFSKINFAQTTWTPVAPNYFPTNVSGQIHGISRCSQMKFHPTNANKMYAVSARGGLFISSNGGTSWALAPGCDIMPSGTRMASVCIDHTNDSIIYLGGGDHNYYSTGSGVWKSTNAGNTFTQTTLTGKIVCEMVMDPTNNQVIVAATNTGIYKTTNAGSTWTLKSTSRTFDDLKQKSPTSRTLYAATTDSAFFRSIDFGETWTQITSGIVLPTGVTNGDGCRVAVTPADTNVVYFGMVGNAGMLYKSTNGGTTFTAVKTAAAPYLTYYTNLSTDVGQGDYNFGIGVDRVNPNIVYMVAHAVWKSTDGGVTWTQLTNWWAKVHTDMHQIVVNPYNSAHLYNVNDGGVWLSIDGGNNWTPKSDGINGYEIYHGSCSPTRRDMISIGTQDNGELYYANTGTGWFTNRGGDWTTKCAFDYTANSQRVYYFNSAKRRNVTGSEATFGLPRTSFKDISFYRSNANVAAVGDSNLYITANLTATTPTWTQVGTLNKNIVGVHMAQNDSNTIFVVTSDQLLFVTKNAFAATPTFTQYTLPVGSSVTGNIVSKKSNAAIVYVALGSKVYRSADYGATWTNVSYNLPTINYIDIITDDFNPDNELMIVAGGNAVYYKIGSATTWTSYVTGLPIRTNIYDLSIYDDGSSNALMRVSTYGRGMWEVPITSLRSLSANFSASINTPCVGQSVQYTDASTGNPTSWSWSFPGGTPSTSTQKNPLVVYNTPGNYNVTLTVGVGTSTQTMTKTNFIAVGGSALPLAEGFELATFPPDAWSNIDAGADGKVWTRSTTASGFGASTACMTYQNYTLSSGGLRDEMQSPKVSLSGFAEYWLKFDVAYQQYSTSATYNDSLAVGISNNCGVSFNNVYYKAGTTLATVAGTNSASFTPTATQWRTDSINLTTYSNQSIQSSFINIGRYGNNLFIDNVKIEGKYPFVTLNMKLYIEGFYDAASNSMTPVIDAANYPTNADTVTLSLAQSISPYNIVYTDKKVVSTNGQVSFTFPLAALNQSYYLVIKHRNSLETWSKNPILFNSANKSFDITAP
jgi:PKD repeat protein